MQKIIRNYVCAMFGLAPVAALLLSYSQLPASLPARWSLHGEALRAGPKDVILIVLSASVIVSIFVFNCLEASWRTGLCVTVARFLSKGCLVAAIIMNYHVMAVNLFMEGAAQIYHLLLCAVLGVLGVGMLTGRYEGSGLFPALYLSQIGKRVFERFSGVLYILCAGVLVALSFRFYLLPFAVCGIFLICFLQGLFTGYLNRRFRRMKTKIS